MHECNSLAGEDAAQERVHAGPGVAGHHRL